MAYWTFNDYSNGTLVSNTLDSSGNKHTVTNTNTGFDVYNLKINSSTPSVVGNHMQRAQYDKDYDAKSHCTTIGSGNVYTNNMTISFWGTQPSVNWRNYISLRTESTLNELQFQRADSGLIVYKTDDKNVNPVSMVGNANLGLDSNWHHFVVTVDSSTQKAYFYVDGVKQAESTWTFAQKVTQLTFDGLYSSNKRNSDAKLDEIQVYNQSMTAEQVAFLYNNPSLYIATGYERNVTADGNWSDAQWSANGQTNQAFANSSAVALTAQNAPTLTLTTDITVNSIDFIGGSMTIDGNNSITLNGEKRITVLNAEDNAVINAPIKTQYNNDFTKTGAGTLTLAAVNTYTGATTISEGTLALSGAGNLTGTSVVNIASGATLEFKDSDNITFSKKYLGDGSIVKSGTGNLTLTFKHTQDTGYFTGSVLVNGGTLTLGVQDVFGSPSRTSSIVVDNAVVTNSGAVFNHLTKTTFKNGAKLVATNGAGDWKAFMLSGYTRIEFSGDGSVAENPVIFEATGTTLTNATICSRDSNTISVADITKSADSDLIISAVLADSYDHDTYKGTIHKSGAGTMELTAANTFTGATTINEGTLKLTGAGNLLNTSSVSVASGATLEFKDSNISFSKAIAGEGDLVKSGTGTVTLTQAVTDLFGNTTISGGGLTLQNGGTLNNLIGGSLIADGADSDVFVNLTSNAALTLNNSTEMTKFVGSITASGQTITKTGNETLQICTGAEGKVTAHSLVVSSGELDFKGYMTDSITVDANAVFSPGNSVGDAVFGGGFILKEGATLLIEQDATGIDTLTASSFELEGSGGNIEFDFTAFLPGKEYDYIFLTDGFGEGQDDPGYWENLYAGNLPGYFTTSVFINDAGYGVVRLTSPSANEIPEPSTWALLVLGVAGLMYWRKKK